jgi:hypothetical protein
MTLATQLHMRDESRIDERQTAKETGSKTQLAVRHWATAGILTICGPIPSRGLRGRRALLLQASVGCRFATTADRQHGRRP